MAGPYKNKIRIEGIDKFPKHGILNTRHLLSIEGRNFPDYLYLKIKIFVLVANTSILFISSLWEHVIMPVISTFSMNSVYQKGA